MRNGVSSRDHAHEVRIQLMEEANVANTRRLSTTLGCMYLGRKYLGACRVFLALVQGGTLTLSGVDSCARWEKRGEEVVVGGVGVKKYLFGLCLCVPLVLVGSAPG